MVNILNHLPLAIFPEWNRLHRPWHHLEWSTRHHQSPRYHRQTFDQRPWMPSLCRFLQAEYLTIVLSIPKSTYLWTKLAPKLTKCFKSLNYSYIFFLASLWQGNLNFLRPSTLLQMQHIQIVTVCVYCVCTKEMVD